MIIELEGIDGSGKSTIAALLAKTFDTEVVTFRSLDYLQTVMEYVEHKPDNILARFILDLAGDKLISHDICVHRISTEPKIKGNVILDRYVYSTLVTNIALDRLYNNGESSKLIKKLFESEIKRLTMPDLVVFLYVDMEVQKTRVDYRKRKNVEMLDKNEKYNRLSENLFKETANQLKKKKLNFIEIDTTNKSPLEVLEIIKTHIKTVKKWSSHA